MANVFVERVVKCECLTDGHIDVMGRKNIQKGQNQEAVEFYKEAANFHVACGGLESLVFVRWVFNATLPTGVKLRRRRVTLDKRYGRCNMVKSIPHDLFWCEVAKGVRKAVGWWERLKPFFRVVNVRDILYEIFHGFCVVELGQFGCVAWVISTKHNSVVRGAGPCDPIVLAELVDGLQQWRQGL
ncbi:Uncharacterized protein Fot_41871 [Forsythia ovata]|uniref:Uncharacterized protein n=1 Tax=Forsythia ovata TaxID=205694 RepID=A0ABD1RKK7_9LAMI